MRSLFSACFFLCVAIGCGSSDDVDDSCAPDDADGIADVDITVAISVTDAEFGPAIVKTQNSSNVTLTLTNNGTKAHGFTIECLPTPNARGCPAQSCFGSDASIAPIAPGASATVKFASPAVEGIYTYRSDAAGDTFTGQFILQ